jgi:hypothetical protein
MNDELERIWKEAILVDFRMLYQDSTGDLMKTMKNLCPGRDLNRAPSKHESDALLPESICQVDAANYQSW